ncbi:tryptophan synthase subunit beta [Candidatus Harpocratesius sp.]
MNITKYNEKYPSDNGKFGSFGGMYIPETLVSAINELKDAYKQLKSDPSFINELKSIRKNFMGRPTPLTFAKNLSKKYHCQIYLKREDLLHGGAHKLNNTIAQALIAKKMGKTKLIAETGAGQHGFATAIAGAYFGMKTKIFMGSEDMIRQKHNVERMKLLGAEIIPVNSGTKTLKDAISEALRYWITCVEDTYYLIGSVVGPHPYPLMVRDFQKVIGEEIREQLNKLIQKEPNAIIACVGGGSNAIGAFYEFIENPNVELYGIEAAGKGANTDFHSLALNRGIEGILHGSRQLLLQDKNRNILNSYSISAGLDYPGVGPELCYLKSIGRINTDYINDTEAIKSFIELSRMEGIIPALESSHAIAFGLKLASKLDENNVIVINLSGQGAKDIERVIPFISGQIEQKSQLKSTNNTKKEHKRNYPIFTGGCFC